MSHHPHTLPLAEAIKISPKALDKLEAMGISTLWDLLLHTPARYEDLRHITPIKDLRLFETRLVEGQIVSNQIAQGRRQSLLCRLSDASGSVGLRFYHFGAALSKQLSPGARLRCYGEARSGVTGIELYHPEVQLLDSQRPTPLDPHWRAVYPSTRGITQDFWRRAQASAFDLLPSLALPDLLGGLLEDALGIERCLRYLHYPIENADVDAIMARKHPAQTQLALEELAVHQLALLLKRQQIQQLPAPVIDASKAASLQAQLLANLPFEPTAAQLRVLADIAADLQSNRSMMRLLQGDVGSGKTLVAALAAVLAIANGYQAALMAPTEILAEQHFQVLDAWLQPLGLQTALLVGKLNRRKKNEQYLNLLSGKADIVVGTQALIQKPVSIPGLGLVIIDEQHRFGVKQRLRLSKEHHEGDSVPHQLILTATPIPRTLAQLHYADLDLSYIDEMPRGRKPVISALIDEQRRLEVAQKVDKLLASAPEGANRQCYWVCPFIEESETLNKRAAEKAFDFLKSNLAHRRIALLHGRIKADAKSAIMTSFKDGEIDILVATTVIEVGVDCPNAVVMVIENSEHMGLAQLHQLRGRVGRGDEQSYCLFLYQGPLSANAQKRLQVLKTSNSGLEIAETDLQLRGSGELVGTRQSGLRRFRFVDGRRGAALSAKARELALELLKLPIDKIDLLLKRWGQRAQDYVRA